MMSDIWVERYKPRKLSQVVGQWQAVQQMQLWAQGWARGKPPKKALLIYGSTGTGKSVAAAALARDLGWDLVEMNASDKRTMVEIQRVAGSASTSGTLLGGAAGRRLIVLDEADNIHGNVDRGGYKALKELVESTRNPLILIANDQQSIPWDIRASCYMVGFSKLPKEAIANFLQKILKEEGIVVERDALDLIADESKGDLRSAVQDLQTVALGRKKLTVEEAIPFRRDREKSVQDFLNGLLSAKSAHDARELSWMVDMLPEEILAWISENAPRMVADAASLVEVYDAISRADVFFGRAKRGQAYGLWSFANDLMTAGVSVRKGAGTDWRKFEYPSHIRRYSRTIAVRAVRDSIARKLARHCHTSSNIVRRDFLPYFALLKIDRGLLRQLAGSLELTEGEVNYLLSL